MGWSATGMRSQIQKAEEIKKPRSKPRSQERARDEKEAGWQCKGH